MKFLKEGLKSLLLLVFILVGVILFKEEPVEAKEEASNKSKKD